MPLPNQPIQGRPASLPPLVFLILIPLSLLSGCAQPGLSDQANLSRPGMQFSGSAVLSSGSSLVSTIEPGTEDRGSASASGCTVCR
jgi:hypothetical protein